LTNVLLYVFDDCNQLVGIISYCGHITNSNSVVGISQVFETLHLVEFFCLTRSLLFGALNLSEYNVSFDRVQVNLSRVKLGVLSLGTSQWYLSVLSGDMELIKIFLTEAM
jgi:hypothetical protein